MATSSLLTRMKPDLLQLEDSLDGGPPSVSSVDTAAHGVIFQAPSPLSIKIEPDMLQLDESLDEGPPSVGSGDIAPPVAVTTPNSTKKKSGGKKLISGYILYSSNARKYVTARNPDSSFGEISRIVGKKWRNLPAHEKQCWEERAAKVSEETAAKIAEEAAAASANSMTPTAQKQMNSNSQDQGPENVIFECCWDTCDWQVEDLPDCIEHCMQELNIHVHQHFANIPQQETEYECLWRGCVRIKKAAQPFPSLQRLARHVKEVHIQKVNGRIIPLHDRSKHFVVSRPTRVLRARPTPAPSNYQSPLQNASRKEQEEEDDDDEENEMRALKKRKLMLQIEQLELQNEKTRLEIRNMRNDSLQYSAHTPEQPEFICVENEQVFSTTE